MIDLTKVLPSPNSVTDKIVFNVGKSTSPFTGGVQTTEMPGAKTVLKYAYENLDIEAGRTMKGILALLKGGAEIAHIRDYSHLPRYSQPKGSPTVDGENQSGNTLKISGINPNTELFIFGDKLSYIATDGLYHVHTVTDFKVESDKDGKATVSIAPPLHNPPRNGSYIETVTPVVSVTCTDSGETSIQGMITAISFEFTESLYTMD